MKILNYKLFETVYVGKIGLIDYNFVYDPSTKSSWIKVSSKDNNYELEVKSVGVKKESEDDGKVNEMRIFAPSNVDFDISELTDKIVYISNKNRLGYKLTKTSVIKPKYGLQPYATISIEPSISMEDFEKVISSTKSTNNMVKKGGDTDQFTF